MRGGLRASPAHEVLIEESVLGWKEYELEVVRDRNDNCIVICSIENVDPMGVHTGDSVTVAPALTLTDKEYQLMRNAAIAVLREIGVDTGGSNVQFAVNPEDGRLVIIEMNPRVSRSSALASKATGFPIAKVAAKLAVGYTLDELDNEITRVTPASFEPTIDYIVTKMPRFTFEKFPGAEPLLTTSMKSVGEAMAIGRSFAESVQKALRSMETGLDGFDEVAIEGVESAGPEAVKAAVKAALAKPSPDRLLLIAQAYRHGLTTAEIHAACRYDRWFLERIREIVEIEERVRQDGLPGDPTGLLRLKQMGFSDARLARLAGIGEEEVAALRHRLGVHPVYKRIDTCAAEFPSLTPYMYSCYEGDGLSPPECEADPSERDKVIILGGGPNRIGQGIEFDYCCVHAAYSLSEAGIETIMVNCNPETVSTDYDTSDRLYFEPLTAEDVIEIVRVEASRGRLLGVIVQFGGQTPLNLAKALERAQIPILGTSPDAIDLAEDRQRFQLLLRGLGLRQPDNGTAYSPEEAEAIAQRYRLSGGDPAVLCAGRPGDGDRARHGRAQPLHPPRRQRLGHQPGVDRPLSAERDRGRCRCRRRRHRGLRRRHHGAYRGSRHPFRRQRLLAAALQPRPRDDRRDRAADRRAGPRARCRRADECAVRGQGRRGVRARGQPARLAHRAVCRQGDRRADRQDRGAGDGRREAGGAAPAAAAPRAARRRPCRGQGGGVSVRALPGRRSDPRAGDEIDRRGHGARHRFRARLRQVATRQRHRSAAQGCVFVSVRDPDKAALVEPCRQLVEWGFELVATRGTASKLSEEGLPVSSVNKVQEGRPDIVDEMRSGRIQLVFNTTEGAQAIADSFSLRRTALTHDIPYYTTVAGARAAVQAIGALREGCLEVAPLQSYF